MKKPHLILQPGSRLVPIKDRHNSVLDALLDAGLEISHECGGMGSCTTCRVLVESPIETLPERNELEREIAAEKELGPAERLACQLEPKAGIVLRIPQGR